MITAVVVLCLSNGGLLWLLRHVLNESAKERRLLNACIQRPQTAVTAVNVDLAGEPFDSLPYVPFDDDNAYNESVKG